MARWYIIHAYSGFEGKVRDAIMAEATRLGLEQLVEQIEVPTETVTEARRGKKIAVERKFMPGYVLAKLVLIDRQHLGNLLGISSFIAYGLLCTVVGYLAPAPPRAPDPAVEPQS